MILKLIAVAILTVVFKIDNVAANSDNPIDPRYYPYAERNESNVRMYPDSTPSADPYEWLENTTLDITQQFIQEQMKLTKLYLDQSAHSTRIKSRIKQLWNLEKFKGPFRKGINFFSYRSKNAEEQDILYVHDEPIGDGIEFLNPNTLRNHVVHFQNPSSAFSQDGKVFAYLVIPTNSQTRFSSIQFKHLEKGFIYEDIPTTKNSKIAWIKNDGIFYSKIDYKKKILEIYYHKLGTDEEKDVLITVYEYANQDYHFSLGVTDDDKYFIVNISKDGKNVVSVADLEAVDYQKGQPLIFLQIVHNMVAKYEYVTTIDSRLIFLTNEDAPNSKLVSVDIENPYSWIDLVPEDEKLVLDWARPAWDRYIVLAYIAEDITSALQLFNVAPGSESGSKTLFNVASGSESGSKTMSLQLPVGRVKAESFYSDKQDPQIYFNVETFFTPCIVYKFNLTYLSSPYPTEIKRITVPEFDPVNYVVNFVNLPTHQNNAMIPTYIVHRKHIILDRCNFTFLTASGGFGTKLLPYFSIERAAVLHNMNGVLVVANIRGGGEKGEKWHIDGSMHNKQNSMTDFQTVALYLFHKEYTSPEFLAIFGGFDGISGPLIGASLNQTPDFFRVVIAKDGLMDMFRFDQFEFGRGLVNEYGSPEVAEDFKYLKRYSPLHNVNIRSINYPAVLLLTSMKDNRVPDADIRDIRVPAVHSLKFIAELQYLAKESHTQQNALILQNHWITKTRTRLMDLEYIIKFIVMNIEVGFKL